MNLSPVLETDCIERSVLKVCDHIENKQINYKHWSNLPEYFLWHELISCILGSQVRFETAKACTDRLIEKNLLDMKNILNEPRKYEKLISNELRKDLYPPFEGTNGSKYRYPNTKSKYIVTTCIRIYKDKSTTLISLLKECKNAFEAREKLIKNCMGIGPKQASLFLRNIVYCDNLAILDSHVMDFMKIMKLNDTIAPKIVANKKQYLKNEKILINYAENLNRNLSSLDIAIWVVMRVIKREFV